MFFYDFAFFSFSLSFPNFLYTIVLDFSSEVPSLSSSCVSLSSSSSSLSVSTLYCLFSAIFSFLYFFLDMLFPSLLCFFFGRFIHTKNLIKKLTIGKFFSLFSNFISLFLSSISVSVKLSTSPVFFYEIVREMFCVSFIALRLELYVYPSRGLFYFIPIFNFADRLIKFSVYEAIFCVC